MKISLQRISTKNLATLVQRTIQSSKSGQFKLVESHSLLTKLEQVYTDYDAVYTKQTFSGKGSDVASADEERDKIYVALRDFLFGYHQVDSVPHSDKAKDLYEVFQRYGTNINRLSYSEETAQLKKLIEELEEERNQVKLEQLSLTTAFNELKEKQSAFEMLYSVQAEANAELRKLPSATAIRRDLEQALKTYLNLLSVMKSQPEWSNLYLDINELVKAAKR